MADEAPQFELDFAAPSLPLDARLYHLGLPRTIRVTATRNRTTLVSMSRRGGLRLHAGYSAAPDVVLQAIIRFTARRVSRDERLAARRILVGFPAQRHAAPRPRRRVAAVVPEADRPVIARLRTAHDVFNTRHFDGALDPIAIHLSERMRRRLGEFRVAEPGAAPEIIVSRRHLRRDGWDAALETLLHEMVHQWQAETGRPVNHGRDFRARARAIGIPPRAVAQDVSGLSPHRRPFYVAPGQSGG